MANNKQIFSTITGDGQLELTIQNVAMPEPEPHEVVVRMEAAPINPSDMFPLFGMANVSAGALEADGDGVKFVAPVPPEMMRAMKSRLDQTLPVGNEGAGTVVATGDSEEARALDGKLVAMLPRAAYAQYVCVPAQMCLPHHDGTTALQAASSFVNPLTALGFLETMRLDGHTAIIHTAAASNLGQMLVKLCRNENVPLVNIVRKSEQVDILKALGAEHIVNSSDDDFAEQLVAAIDATGATLAYDATGGGTLADTILGAMERSLSKAASGLNTYGSDTFKQVYLYGGLDLTPTQLKRGYGMSWGIGGWLMPLLLARVGAERAAEMRARVAEELTTTFASSYTAEISLTDAISPDFIARYLPKKTGEKYIINPQKDA